MIQLLCLKDFKQYPGTMFDVRSPAEYAHAHIPGAQPLPLFTNEERAQVGTVYKQQGKDQAIALGLKLVGPKLADFVAQAQQQAPTRCAKLYCWRGGMRSSAMAWLLNFAGISSVLLEGGYKTYRHWCLANLALPYRFVVLGGLTGSGKTAILHALSTLGEQILDLEALANHRGSAYGNLGNMQAQPSTEHFENAIAERLHALDPQLPIWVEDESRLIGTCHIPSPLFAQMRGAPFVCINIPIEERLERLFVDYGQSSAQHLESATLRIARHLGSQRTSRVFEALRSGLLIDAMRIVLQYYDATYLHTLARKPSPLAIIDEAGIAPLDHARKLQQLVSRSLINQCNNIHAKAAS